MDYKLVEKYEGGGDRLAQAIAGLTLEQLKARPVTGKWSTHEVVVHLADAEASFADRIRRIIAEDEPQLLAWDETKFFGRLHYDRQSTADAVESIRILRRQTARILKALKAEDWTRAGIHSQRGRQTLTDVVNFAIGHMDQHLNFIADKRAALGVSPV